MIKRFIYILMLTLLVQGCSVTKNLPEGEVLYIGQKPMQIQGNDSLSAVGDIALKR